MNERIDYLREKASELTKSPGIYLMHDKSKKVIYVGKAKNLTNRVRSYFRKSAKHDEKVRKMVENVFDFDYIVTDSEFEALVLECSLIKQHNPKYNILLKDDKGYHYIRITNEDYPRITAEKMKNKTDKFIGPYTSTFAVKQAVEAANRVFMLPTCSKKFPADFGKTRPCLNFHIKQCFGLCKGKMDKSDYIEIINSAVDYMKSGTTQSIEQLRLQMESEAERLNFEKAGKIRDRIRAIEKITAQQKVILSTNKDQDVIAGAQNNDIIAFVVLKFRHGQLSDKETFIFYDAYDIANTRNEFITRYYSQNSDIPKHITIDEKVDDVELLQEYIAMVAGHNVVINIPQKGEQKKMVLMAMNNASEQLSSKVKRTGKEVVALDELTRLLGLDKTPNYIEAYDISNLGDTGIVAGMVVFENGRPLKSAYRKFSIKDMPIRDDYKSMEQVLTRRLKRYQDEKESGEGFGKLPDLILLDGGKGHVGVVKPIVDSFGLKIPVFGMVKDDKHRTRAIAETGGEIAINSTRSAFTLITNIQNEVHRFSITYQKNVRKKSAMQLNFTKIAGIGDKKAEKLLKTYKTKAELKKLSVDDIKKAIGVSEKSASELYDMIKMM